MVNDDERRLAYLSATSGIVAIAVLSWQVAAALTLALGLPRMWRFGFRSSRRRGNALVTVTVAAVTVFSIAGVRDVDAKMPVKLSFEARYLAANGGIICRTPGVGRECATPRMRELSRQLTVARFAPAGPWAVKVALCIVGRESGFNPGARSTTGDHGLPQANHVAHRDTVDWKRIYDPVYALGVMWSMSRGGTSWSPWRGGKYPCW